MILQHRVFVCKLAPADFCFYIVILSCMQRWAWVEPAGVKWVTAIQQFNSQVPDLYFHWLQSHEPPLTVSVPFKLSTIYNLFPDCIIATRILFQVVLKFCNTNAIFLLLSSPEIPADNINRQKP